MTTLILMRHGATDYNLSDRLQGSLDVPLGATGVTQARAAASVLTAAYGRPDALLASPLQRAFATAAILGDASGIEPVADARLTQRSYGEWEGLTWGEVRERWPGEYERRQAGLDPAIAGWDSSVQVAARVASALEEACEGRDLVIAVSHGSTIQLGVLALLGLDAFSPVLGKLGHGRWNVLRSRGKGEWVLERFGLGPSGAR